ncbi:MAG: polyisoprenoid-binding protein YceI [Planctomycetota bacterium]|jgi:polyisoprenoid-binding protein YceI
MKLLPIASSLLLATAAALAFGQFNPTQATSTEPTSAARTLTVDGGHSSILFRIQHMEASYFYGRFNEVEGEIVFDEEDPAKSSVALTIMADSVDSNSGKRDEHIKSPDFLDAKQFAAIEFISTKVEQKGDTWKVTGNLEFHGTQNEITVDFEKTGEGKGRGGEAVLGFLSTFTIDRTDYGMDYMIGPLGKELQLTVSLEAKGSK